jgi:hypothetical protein
VKQLLNSPIAHFTICDLPTYRQWVRAQIAQGWGAYIFTFEFNRASQRENQTHKSISTQVARKARYEDRQVSEITEMDFIAS